MTRKLNLQATYFPKRLADDLENIKKYSLTVLEAPSGFGKTTALDIFFSQKYFDDITVLKHTFFADSINEYWQWFCTVLKDTDSISADALQNIGAPCRENMSEICEIIKDLECKKDTYIVLDNLSDAVSGIDLFLSALSRHCADKLHIVASVQSVGAENCSKFLGGGRVYCIGAKDFAFSENDCRTYFTAVGIMLTDAELSELMSITGGWIFAVYLQMLSYAKNKHFEKGILNNLIEKAFFSRLTDEERKFYTELSIFKSFTLRCAVFVSEKDADFVRVHLNGGGFIHYDEKRGEYYFHNLLHEYLLIIFEHWDKNEKNKIYLRAAEWEEEHGEKINAISFYYKAGNYEKIFSMPHTSYDLADIENADTRKMIFDILDKTPYDVKLRYPQSMVPLAFILFFISENEKLAEVIGEIFELAEACELSEEKKNAILGEAEFLISFTEFNDIEKMSVHHRRAYELLGKKASLINMRSTWTFGSPSVMCLYHAKAGELEKELRLMDECMPYYYRLTGGHGNGAEFAMRAEAEFMHGNFDAAEAMAHRAMFEAKSKNQSSIYQCGIFILANVALARGDEEALSDALFAMSESASSNTEDMCRYTLSLFLGYIYALLHRTDKLDGWLLNGDIDETRLAPMTVPFAHIIYAKALLEKKEYVKLLAFCPFAEKSAAELPSVLPQIYFNIFISSAHMAADNKKAAAAALEKALLLAEHDEIYMPFAQNFSLIRESLENFKESPSYAKICKLGTSYEKSLLQIGAGKPKLSPREREVAELIRQGLTNKQIAARLFVSLSTVKMTISNIFDKLEIKSRAQLSDIKI